jgi:EAL domain-containing protein (putative c-di-GMP-specific phosphodiesterase class I)
MHEFMPSSTTSALFRPSPNVLLVSANEAWRSAVSTAAQQLGGDTVMTVGGRDALTRLARSGPQYSHLLVEHDAAEGIFNELTDLAGEVTVPDIGIFVLGGHAHPRHRSIHVASTHSVIEALLAGSPARELADIDLADIDLADLRSALDDAKIDTRYQPIVRMSDRKPVGLEALARLHHPEHGLIQPDRFVPLAEAAGLAGRLTEIVAARSFADMATVALQSRQLTISVNFPLDVLLCPQTPDRLEADRIAAGIPADRIIIELTESRPVDDVVTLGRVLDRLRTLGYGAAIDDVGPAVPRLAPLLELPFTSLKLDKEMVSQVIAAPTINDFLCRTIDAAKAANLTVVAEGVETAEIWSAIAELGADHAQGYLVSRPLPRTALPIWLDHWKGVFSPPA